ncbi:MAG: Transcriptional regulatory protein ZraR [Alphaproteobacteria bacterium MarineAlpha2_Bin1]|nr:MAG: Transcriptional regulatory protein ZraR [Alphaproteobacteria bacterium MarineAlpha2_Bin1]
MRLLIIGSMDGQIGAASKIAIDRGAKVSHTPDILSALTLLRSGKGAELLMIDAILDIENLCKSLEEERISAPVVAYGIGTNTEAAVKAIKAGAKEYIPLPPESDLIAAVLEAVCEESHTLIYTDSSMKKMIQLTDQIAPSDASILITGESGTGKEVLARYIHRKSSRKDKAFISLNCAAIPENLLESELFGHEKGSFTGAITRRIGKFEEANGGTLLLDEISELHPRLQAKLLRAIQEREIDRVGGNKPIKIDIRLLATSNRNLEEEVKKGTFREDLLFRLNVLNLKLPSLRERPGDLKILAEHFIEKYSKINNLKTKPLTLEALEGMKSYKWPGNVRELENTMHRAVLLGKKEEIGTESVIQQDGSPLGLNTTINNVHSTKMSEINLKEEQEGNNLVGRTVAQVEKDLILDTLNHCLGNRTHAAKILGISIRTLRNKLKQYNDDGLEVETSNSSFRAA